MAGIAIFLTGFYAVVQIRYPRKYESIIREYSQSNNVEYELIQSVIWTESKFKKDAVSRAGAIGLMQLMPATAEWCASLCGVTYDEKKLTEPDYNIRLGTFYLKYLLDMFDAKDAVAAYNAGQGNVSKWLSQGLNEYPFKETRDYVHRVFSAKKIYHFINK